MKEIKLIRDETSAKEIKREKELVRQRKVRQDMAG